MSYGQSPLYDYTKIIATQNFAFGQTKTLAMTGVYEDQTSQSTTRADAQVFDIIANFQMETANDALWTWSITARKNASQLVTDTFYDTGLQASYSPPWHIIHVKPTFSAGIGYKSYDDFILSLDGRRDRYSWAGLGMVFDKVSAFGFSPEVQLTHKRTRSNVARYDTSELKIAVGVKSQF
ncbi:MAG: hypothetical protein U5N55_13505 [Cypionkella sp.]|nr:hypothetical protein [Cypionkella sp.]